MGALQDLGNKEFSITQKEGDKGVLFHHRRRVYDGQFVLLVNTSIDSPCSGSLGADASGIRRWDLHTGEVSAYLYFRKGDLLAGNTDYPVIAYFTLPPSGSLLLFLSNKQDSPVVLEPLGRGGPGSPVGEMTVRRVTPNVLTLDFVEDSVRRAFGLLFREMAEVVHLEEGVFANYSFQSWREISEMRADEKQPHDDWICAVNFEIQIPRVVRLLIFDRVPKQRFHLNRRGVLARDGHCCQYCGRRFPSHQLSLDHVIPRSHGGPTTWENVVCACLKCNTKKGGRTPKEARMKLVCRPLKPKRNPILLQKLNNPKYQIWRTWIDGAPLPAV